MPHPVLTEADVAKLNDSQCPDCDGLIYEGPCGGGSINYVCGNERCGSRFNMALSWERISEISPLREDGDSVPTEVPTKEGPIR